MAQVAAAYCLGSPMRWATSQLPPSMKQASSCGLLVLFLSSLSSCDAVKASQPWDQAPVAPVVAVALARRTHAVPEASNVSSQKSQVSQGSSYTRRWSKHPKELADVEDMDYFWGTPVLAWVVVVDVIAFILYVIGMRTVSSLAARKKAEDADYFLQSPVWSSMKSRCEMKHSVERLGKDCLCDISCAKSEKKTSWLKMTSKHMFIHFLWEAAGTICGLTASHEIHHFTRSLSLVMLDKDAPVNVRELGIEKPSLLGIL